MPGPGVAPCHHGPVTSRWIVLVVLACGAVSRSADANPHHSYGYVPFVLALYVLPLWYASGWRREVWVRHRWGLLALQAVGTYIPFAVFGHGWVGGVSGLLGGLVLLVVPGRRGWLLFAGLAAVEAGCWLLVGLPYAPPANALGWVLIAFTYQGLPLYGLTRLADLNDRLDATRTALAEAAVTRLRLAATERVNTVILRRLDELTALAERALRPGSADDARQRLAAAGQVARQASADARRLAEGLVEGLPEPRVHRPPESTGPGAVTPALARAVVTVVVASFAGTYVLNIAFPISVPPHGWGLVTTAVVIAAAMAALQWRHVSYGGARRPAGWPWTLAAQTVLSLALYPAVGAATIGLLIFPGASALLLLRHWSRWLCVAAVVAGVPVLAFLGPADLLTVRQIISWSVYAAASEASACLTLYGLAQLTRAAALLHEVRRELAAGAADAERLRLARDAHDTLGLGLSTVALKTDLAAALLTRDPARAQHEIAQLVYVAGGVARDAAAVTSGQVQLDLGRELDSAARTLRAAGITTSITTGVGRPADDLPPPVRAAFAAVTREAITNVLRHSQATRCTIALGADAGGHTLAISNDGSGGDVRSWGQGLANMAQRIEALGGSVRADARGDEFVVTATVPEPRPAAVGSRA